MANDSGFMTHEGWEQYYANLFAERLLNTKYVPDKKTAKLLSVSTIRFFESSIKSDLSVYYKNDLTKTLDTTTYPDKAILTLYNGIGVDVYLTSVILHGKRIMQYSGEMGELLHDSLKRDDDIRRNGETVFEIGNEFIVTADQCNRIADFWFKFLGKKKHLYVLQIPGLAAWYNVGDWYNLQVGEAGKNEYIDAVVECYSVDCERTAGGIGGTTLLLRDVEDNWSKTTLYAARLATGGSPKRRASRSNIVTVGSAEYDGPIDYDCDGTDDDVEIQAAIDYVSTIQGGGTVTLTNGTYTLGAALTMKSNVILKGVGNNTILKPESSSITTMIDFGTATGASIVDFVIDGYVAAFTTDAMKVVDGQNLGSARGVTIQNYSFSGGVGINIFSLFYEIVVESCAATGNVCNNGGTSSSLRIFDSCKNVSSCSSSGNTTNGSFSTMNSFYSCKNVSSCSSSGNTIGGIGISSSAIISFYVCTNLSACSSYSNTATGTAGSVYSFYACTNLSACSSYSNTATGTSGIIYSFFECERITVSSTSGNVSTSSDEYGFYSCHSVQQCNSTDDSIPYGTGASQSYADAGTTNPCQDTAAGGYNS